MTFIVQFAPRCPIGCAPGVTSSGRGRKKSGGPICPRDVLVSESDAGTHSKGTLCKKFVRSLIDIYTFIRICVPCHHPEMLRRRSFSKRWLIRHGCVCCLWRDLRLRTNRYLARGAAESVTSPGSSEARRPGGSTPRGQMDVLSLGAAWRSARSSRARGVARVDGQRPSDEW